MDENLTSQTRHRISGKAAVAGRVSHSCADSHSHECAYEPGQNGGFSDGFPTKSPVVTRYSGQPRESTDPENPMKSEDNPPCKGLPPVPPATPVLLAGVGSWSFSAGPRTPWAQPNGLERIDRSYGRPLRVLVLKGASIASAKPITDQAIGWSGAAIRRLQNHGKMRMRFCAHDH
jgi:hypothetical protein